MILGVFLLLILLGAVVYGVVLAARMFAYAIAQENLAADEQWAREEEVRKVREAVSVDLESSHMKKVAQT